MNEKNAFLKSLLKEGEQYAGLLLGKKGAPDQHIILLPGEAQAVNWDDAKKFEQTQAASCRHAANKPCCSPTCRKNLRRTGTGQASAARLVPPGFRTSMATSFGSSPSASAALAPSAE